MRRSTEVKVTFDFNDFAEALTSTEKESSAKREAYQTLMARNHFLVLTDVIEEQYLEISEEIQQRSPSSLLEYGKNVELRALLEEVEDSRRYRDYRASTGACFKRPSGQVATF